MNNNKSIVKGKNFHFLLRYLCMEFLTKVDYGNCLCNHIPPLHSSRASVIYLLSPSPCPSRYSYRVFEWFKMFLRMNLSPPSHNHSN